MIQADTIYFYQLRNRYVWHRFFKFDNEQPQSQYGESHSDLPSSSQVQTLSMSTYVQRDGLITRMVLQAERGDPGL